MNIGRYFIKKPVSQIQNESAEHGLKRTLGPINLISLGIGCIIGAGIFVITGPAAAQHAGPAVIISFIIAGLACAFAALCYAELASVLPISGSAYTYSYATLGEVIAWSMAWLLILEYGVASATVAVGWSGYFVSFLKDYNIYLPAELTAPPGVDVILQDGTMVTGKFNLPAASAIAVLALLLVIGVKESAHVNNIIVIAKLAVLITFVGVGAFYVNPDNWVPFIPENTGNEGEYGWSGILKAAGIVFFAYIGFEAVSTAAQEAKNPQRDMPIGILGSLVICTIIYILVSLVLTGIIPYQALNVPDPMAKAVDSVHIGWLTFAVKIGAIMGLSSVMLVLLYGQTRIFYAVSRDGLLPKFFSIIHEKFKTPYINTLFVGAVIAIVAGFTPIDKLGKLVSMGTLFAFTLICFSVLYLRYKEPDLKRPFKTPFMPFTPILGIIFCLYLIWGIRDIFLTLKFYFLAGLVFYFVYGQFGSKLAKSKS